MRCLSIRQPWASLIIAGHKDIENRTWCTAHRGPLLIHAASRVDRHADVRGLLTADDVAQLPRGGIIGVVDVVDCVTASASPWFTGPVGWVLRDQKALPFSRCPGQQGLFEVTPQQSTLRALGRRRLGPLFR